MTGPTDRPHDPLQDPSFAISDGASGGNEHFFFLPPMVKAPGDLANGIFDPTLQPVVQICVWNVTDDECGPDLAIYNTETGPGAETVRVDEVNEMYIVLWHTEEILTGFPLASDEVYRIRVVAEGKELGHAEVVVVSSGKELKNYRTDDVIPLIDGHRMPIKFRIEEGALAVAEPAVSTGGNHTCGLTAEGDAYCWGQNGWGQLGNPTAGSTEPSPIAVAGGRTFVSVVVGAAHTCGLTANGEAYCWGGNYQGQLGNGTRIRSPSPIAVTGGHTFVSLDAGHGHTCGVTLGGYTYCWGYNWMGQIGNGTRLDQLSPAAVTGGDAFVSVDVGANHTCAMTAEGNAYCWGWNSYGQLGSEPFTYQTIPFAVAGGHMFVSLDAGFFRHTCGVTREGTAYCWGGNGSGQLGNGTYTYREPSPVAVASGHTFVSVEAGGYHTCALTVEGDAYCWGANGFGQLGHGARIWLPSPGPVTGGHTFVSVGAGTYQSCGVTTSGDAYCWGDNRTGQLGTGSVGGYEPSPVWAMDLDPRTP
ncbi:MAG: RCC1 domain-containing protein [Planctomycetota bacterium]